MKRLDHAGACTGRAERHLVLRVALRQGTDRLKFADSSGVYICKSIVNDLRHGNHICKSEGIYLTYEHRIEIPVEFTYVNQ